MSAPTGKRAYTDISVLGEITTTNNDGTPYTMNVIHSEHINLVHEIDVAMIVTDDAGKDILAVGDVIAKSTSDGELLTFVATRVAINMVHVHDIINEQIESKAHGEKSSFVAVLAAIDVRAARARGYSADQYMRVKTNAIPILLAIDAITELAYSILATPIQ